MKRRSWFILFAIALSLWIGWKGYRAPQSAEAPYLAVQAQTIAPVANGDRLWADVEALAFRRYEESDRQRARNYLLKELRSAGWTPQLQAFEGGINIWAERPGTDPQAGAILLGAHYDTVAGSPGADDNATAAATVLETARLLSQPTARPLQLALFDLEEQGLLGSQAFVDRLPQPEKIAGAVIMDMIGYACREAGCQSYPPLPIQPPTDIGDFLAAIGDQGHPRLTEAVAQAGQSLGQVLPQVLTLSIPTFGGLTPDLVRSDHTPFWKKGIGAVLLTDTANFRNPNYHRSTDTLETIDRIFFLGSAQVVIQAVADLLQN